MLHSLYHLILDFQTLIVGALGFAGIIYTLRANSKASREQHERVVGHDCEVLKTALRAELMHIQGTYLDNTKPPMDDEGESDAWYPTTTETMVYQSFIHKLGLLSSEQVVAVIKAYTLIEEMPKRIGLLSSGRDPSYDKPGYIFIEVPHTKTVAGVYKSFLPSINDAIDKLKE